MKNIITQSKKFFKEDKKGKTRAFFINNKNRKIDKRMLNDMVKLTKKSRSSIRLCLHKSTDDIHHSMIIIDYKNNFAKPHFHLKTSETHQTILGKLGVIIFSKKGEIIKKYVLDKKNNFLDRLKKGECHILLPISNYVIYHETNNGKFNRKNPDMFFPKWFEKLDLHQRKIFFKNLYKIF